MFIIFLDGENENRKFVLFFQINNDRTIHRIGNIPYRLYMDCKHVTGFAFKFAIALVKHGHIQYFDEPIESIDVIYISADGIDL